jgi:hypothetical protein
MKLAVSSAQVQSLAAATSHNIAPQDEDKPERIQSM